MGRDRAIWREDMILAPRSLTPTVPSWAVEQRAHQRACSPSPARTSPAAPRCAAASAASAYVRAAPDARRGAGGGPVGAEGDGEVGGGRVGAGAAWAPAGATLGLARQAADRELEAAPGAARAPAVLALARGAGRGRRAARGARALGRRGLARAGRWVGRWGAGARPGLQERADGAHAPAPRARNLQRRPPRPVPRLQLRPAARRRASLSPQPAARAAGGGQRAAAAGAGPLGEELDDPELVRARRRVQ